jgi:hydrogenase nickel incorporation protein HypA/HybF
VHEFGVTESVVAAVTERLPGATVTHVHLEIGSLAGVSADSVRLYFGPATEGTDLAGATLEITEVTARCRCRSCSQEYQPDGPIPMCQCGSPDMDVLSGGDMRILAVEVAPAPA